MENHYNARFLALTSPAELEAEIQTIETYAEAVPRVLHKASHRLVRAERLPAAAAMILKQELLALDGDALISPAVYLGDRDATTDALIFATLRQLHELERRLRRLPLPALQALAAEIAALLHADAPADRGALEIGGRAGGRGAGPHVMGLGNSPPHPVSPHRRGPPPADLAAVAVPGPPR